MLERGRNFVERCAGRHDVIDHADMPAANAACCLRRQCKGIQQILASCQWREPSLRRRIADPNQQARQERNAEGRRQGSRDFQRLVEAAFLQTRSTEGYWRQEIGQAVSAGASHVMYRPVRHCCTQLLRKQRRERKPRTEFQAEYQLVEWRGIISGSHGRIESRWPLQALYTGRPAALRAAKLQGAAAAARYGGAEEIRPAAAAQDMRTGRATQRAGAWKPGTRLADPEAQRGKQSPHGWQRTRRMQTHVEGRSHAAKTFWNV